MSAPKPTKPSRNVPRAMATKMVTWPLSLRDHDLARSVVRVRSIFVSPFVSHSSSTRARAKPPEHIGGKQSSMEFFDCRSRSKRWVLYHRLFRYELTLLKIFDGARRGEKNAGRAPQLAMRPTAVALRRGWKGNAV